MIFMALSAAKLGDNDHLLQIIEDLHTSTKPQTIMLLRLAAHYEKHGDLPMAIACYRGVIEECNLPPNSIVIVRAYSLIASAFYKLNDTGLYRRARDLLLKLHESTYPLSARLEISILQMELQQKIQQMEQLFRSLFDQK